MKKARIIARKEINFINDDKGLRALDGIYCSPYMEFADDVHPIDMMNELIEKYSDEFKHIGISNVELDYE